MRVPENMGIWALYSRLSREDKLEGDSNSIINQHRLLEQYAKDNGVTNIQHYTDDGYSGGSFERPAWKKLIEDVEAGKISAVVAKDMSRIGRNYLEVGYYTEIYFPQKRVRFIAINNNVDSNVQNSDEFAPFLNIMNEHMLRETSRKIRAVFQMKGKEGKHIGGNIIYGYKADSEDKKHWIIDEEAAKVVRRIFQLCVEGYGPFQIAGILKEQKVETPGYYMAKQGLGNYQSRLEAMQPYNWNMGTVIEILSRMEYIGHTVSFRYKSESYKTKRSIRTDPSEWYITENTQEPIVDEETWKLVQKLRQTVRRTDNIGTANPFTGLVYCAECGEKMKNRRRRGKPLKSDPTKLGNGEDCYLCRTYANAANQHEKKCSAHSITTKNLRAIVLDVIRAASQSAVEDEAAFRERIMAESEIQQTERIKALEKKLKQDKKRHSDLDALIEGLFEANFTGKISDKRFKTMSEKYETEQAALEESISDSENELAQLQVDAGNVDRFLEMVRHYTDFSELTTPMLNEFVDKIVVHEAEKVDGERTQEVEVYLNFIGRFQLPEVELTAEQLAQLEKEKQKRAKGRERARRYLERKKAREADENTNTVA